MPETHFRPKPGRYGVQCVTTSTGPITAPTANVTTTYFLPTPRRKSRVARVSVSVLVVPVDADGTLLATLKKRDNLNAADVTLSSALDLEALVTKTPTALTFLTTLTDGQLTLQEGDQLFVEIVSNSAAIDTALTQGFLVSELLFLE